jgi:hypothetical protein
MSSRKEEKERLRREREEAERAARASEDRRKRLGIVLGAVLALAVAAIVIVAVTSGGDDGGSETAAGDASVPARQITDLDEAAKAAGCKVEEFESEGRGHTPEDVTYDTNPPTSGSHDPQAAQDGVYPDPPDIEQSVHALEHGRVNVQYKQGTPAPKVSQIETVVGEEVQGTGGYHTLMFENQTDMDAAVAVTSWTRSVTCPTFNDKVFDAIRAFREKAIVGEWAADIPEPIP